MPYAHVFSILSRHLESLVAAGGYPFLFLIVILEGTPLIGTAVPGHITIIAAGFLAREGVLNLGYVLILAITAAILGDFIGFFLGRRYGMSLITRLRPYFFIRDSHIEKARALLHAHTGKAMILGRFSPVTRALMPFLVGASPTPARRYWFFNIIGGVAWAGLSVLLGYAFGAGYHAAAGIFGRVVLGAILLAAVIIWGYRFVNIRFHIFRKYELFTLALNLASLAALAGIIEELTDSSFKLGFDVYINAVMASISPAGSFLATASYWISAAGSTYVMTILGLTACFILAYRARWRSAVIMAFSTIAASLATGLMKEFFMGERPLNALVSLADPSFPSGHAAMAAAFFTSLAYICAPRIHSWVRRELFLVACVLGTILIGLSRLFLNVHWVTDVVAGWALGIFAATASILLVRYVSVLLVRKRNRT